MIALLYAVVPRCGPDRRYGPIQHRFHTLILAWSKHPALTSIIRIRAELPIAVFDDQRLCAVVEVGRRKIRNVTGDCHATSADAVFAEQDNRAHRFFTPLTPATAVYNARIFLIDDWAGRRNRFRHPITERWISTWCERPAGTTVVGIGTEFPGAALNHQTRCPIIEIESVEVVGFPIDTRRATLEIWLSKQFDGTDTNHGSAAAGNHTDLTQGRNPFVETSIDVGVLAWFEDRAVTLEIVITADFPASAAHHNAGGAIIEADIADACCRAAEGHLAAAETAAFKQRYLAGVGSNAAECRHRGKHCQGQLRATC